MRVMPQVYRLRRAQSSDEADTRLLPFQPDQGRGVAGAPGDLVARPEVDAALAHRGGVQRG